MAYFLKNLVMANGLADHDPPHAMQLGPILDREGGKGNEKGGPMSASFVVCHNSSEFSSRIEAETVGIGSFPTSQEFFQPGFPTSISCIGSCPLGRRAHESTPLP